MKRIVMRRLFKHLLFSVDIWIKECLLSSATTCLAQAVLGGCFFMGKFKIRKIEVFTSDLAYFSAFLWWIFSTTFKILKT
jgi:hypothetical protein